jgi:predicted enzyme related to lactoylglutathione lyase
MPNRDAYEHGVPNWIDLSTTDVEGAKAFYTALFGWEADDLPGDRGVPYTMFRKDGRSVAGGGPMQPDLAKQGVPPMWKSYVNVDSVDDTVAKVVAAGGSVTVPAMDVMSEGRMAFVTDPSGAAIGLWEPRDHKGAQLVNEHGTLTWNELMTDDLDSAKAFYSAVFGWVAQTDQMPDGRDYTTFKVGDDLAAGMMAKTPDMEPMPDVWGIYFAVDDCEAAVAKAVELRGTVVAAPFDTPIGKMAVLADPQGATFALVSWNVPTQ